MESKPLTPCPSGRGQIRDARRDLLFAKLLDEVEAPEGWEVPDLPSNPLDLIRSEQEVLPPETIRQMGEAWNRAQREAEEKGPLLDKNQTLDSVFVAGHVLNLFICVEIVANRRLLYLKEEGTI